MNGEEPIRIGPTYDGSYCSWCWDGYMADPRCKHCGGTGNWDGIPTQQPITLEFVLRVLSVFNGLDDHPPCGSLWWRTDDRYAPLTLFVVCSDLFLWASADLQEITPDNVAELERAVADVKAVSKDGHFIDAGELFCCRVRGRRPQKPCYQYIDKELWPLFDACGPEME